MSMLRIKSRKKKGKKDRRRRKRNEKNNIRVRLPYIPQNVMEEIFHKLPYKAMAMSKLVCRRWNSIMSSPNFMNNYYNRLQLEGNTNLIFLEYDKTERKRNFITLSHSELFDSRPRPIKVTPFEDEKGWRYRPPRLIGSYNGLVALSCDHKLILWNPLTNMHSFINVDVYDTYSDFNNFDPRLLYGLCYDSIKDEYSVVVGSDYQSPPVSPTSFDQMVDYESTPVFQYNFKDGKEKVLFNALERRLLDGKLFNGEVGKVICGVPHWVVQYYDWVDPFVKTDILYFDLNEEVLKEMDRPSRCVDKPMLGLAAMNGENELGCVVHDVATSSLEIWVMKEYGKVESWTNLLTFSFMNLSDAFGSLKYMDVMGFMPNNGELLIYLNAGIFLVYDVNKGDFKKITLENRKFESIITFEPKLFQPPQQLQRSADETQ